MRLGLVTGLAWGGLAGARYAYAYATTSPRFEVRGLVYEPTRHVADEDLRRLMALRPGTNILALDLDELAERIVADPWVARAQVIRVLPDTLRVEVTEHQPTAVLLASGRFYLVSEQGQPFKPLKAGERGQLPVVTGIDRMALLADTEGSQTKIRRALDVLLAYAEKQRPRVGEIHVDADGGVTLYTAETGAQLRLGRGAIEPALARFDALRAALAEDAEKLAVIHLDLESAPRRRDRVVASFFPAAPEPQLVAAGQSPDRGEGADRTDADNPPPENPKKKKKSRKKPRIPRYE